MYFDSPYYGGGPLGLPKPQNRTKFGGKTEKPLHFRHETEKPTKKSAKTEKIL